MKPKIEYWRAQVKPELKHPAQLIAFYNERHLRSVVSEALKNGLLKQLRQLLQDKPNLDEATKKVIQNYIDGMEK